MGFYIRKAFTFGPIRLNLSRSGLGFSFGVKGARIGVGPKGTYIHMGRHGLYYRQYLNSKSSLLSDGNSYNLKTIANADVDQLVDVSHNDLIIELNRVKNYFEIFPLLLMVFSLFVLAAFYYKVSFLLYGLLFIITVLSFLYGRHIDVTRGTAILDYQLETETNLVFNSIKNAFKDILSCSKSGYVKALAETDAKHCLGAPTGGKMLTIHPCLSLPPRVQSNIKEVPTLMTDSQRIYFFPDLILVYDKSGIGSISYNDLKIAIKQQRFVEQERVPDDAQVVGSTWQYVNKKGGPDLRFKDNPEFPIVLYDFMNLTNSNGFNQLFFFSHLDGAVLFAQSLVAMGVSYSKVTELDVKT